MTKNEWEQIFEANRESFIEGWKNFLQFPSISSDPAYAGSCIECANWLVTELKRIGFESKLLETPGKPVVYAHFKGKKDKTRVVYYGHYDVQPIDPENLWHSPPFTPVLREGRLYARGAQDNKGQSWYFIKALEQLIKLGKLQCDLKIFMEGEEESSSTGISQALPAWKELLSSDILMVCDTGMYRSGVPAITMGLRGIIFLSVALSGPRCDLHSGIHGGVIPNPACEMAKLVASLYNADGSIAVAGFYDGLAEVDAHDLKLALAEPIDLAGYEQMVGVAPVGGEQGIGAIERRGFRPTLEINGIHSGYDGPGSKTIIPAEANCKITARLVAGQDPQRCLDKVIEHLRKHAPPALKLEISEAGVGGPAVRVSAKSKAVSSAAKVLQSLGDGQISYIWEGASIPIVASMAQISGAEPLLVGFGLEQDNIHAPNESFSIEQFKQGFLYTALYLSELSR